MRSRKQTKRENGQLASGVATEWCQIHQQALETFVDCLTATPILAFPEYEKDFIPHVDANEKGPALPKTSESLLSDWV